MATPLHTQLDEAAQRVIAAFPDRPILEVDFYQQSNGRFVAYVGKATRMRRFGKSHATVADLEAATIAALRAED